SVLSCADAIASVLERYINGEMEEMPAVAEGKPKLQVQGGKTEDYGLARNIAGQCPDCGGLLAYEEGCYKCTLCGYTKC
ncbi:MAG: ribonucleotide-diphosphate reductase subunit alpha, partial [bacterium]|nr:ribonucleotide-diphosphate reductase subunit alpha [bacterium]